MEWFKHKTNALNDPVISDAIDKFGLKGYAVFFMFLEIYGREFNKLNGEGELTLTRRFVCRELRSRWTTVELLLNYYETSANWKVKVDTETVTVKIPKFIDISSNWTKRINSSPLEVPPEVPRSKEEKRREENKKKKKNKKESYPTWLNVELWNEFKKMRVKIKAPMTEKAEELAMAKLKTLIDKGYDQVQILSRSIENCWKGLFAPKDEDPGIPEDEDFQSRLKEAKKRSPKK